MSSKVVTVLTSYIAQNGLTIQAVRLHSQSFVRRIIFIILYSIQLLALIELILNVVSCLP